MTTFLELVDFFTVNKFMVSTIFGRSYIACHICHESWITGNLYQATEYPDFSDTDIAGVEFRMRDFIERTGMTIKKRRFYKEE